MTFVPPFFTPFLTTLYTSFCPQKAPEKSHFLSSEAWPDLGSTRINVILNTFQWKMTFFSFSPFFDPLCKVFQGGKGVIFGGQKPTRHRPGTDPAPTRPDPTRTGPDPLRPPSKKPYFLTPFARCFKAERVWFLGVKTWLGARLGSTWSFFAIIFDLFLTQLFLIFRFIF